MVSKKGGGQVLLREREVSVLDENKLLEELKKLNDRLSSILGFMLSLDEKLDQIRSGTTLILIIVGMIFGFLIVNRL